jgi:hypothetical protein
MTGKFAEKNFSLFNYIPTVHGVVFAKKDPGAPPLGNPFDSTPILIRLRAVPNLSLSGLETSLVRDAKTPSSRHGQDSRDMLRERNGTQSGVSDSAAIRSRVVPKLKANRKSVAK